MPMEIVKAKHLGGELIAIEFEHSYLISDHPPRRGGGGKGPTPAELLMCALVSSSILAIQAHAFLKGFKVSTVAARASPKIDREGIDGPLKALAFLSQIALKIEILGDLTSEERAALAAAGLSTDLTTLLSNGVAISERVDLKRGRRGQVDAVNRVFLEDEYSLIISPGDTHEGARETNWRVNAIGIEHSAVLAQLVHSTLVVGREPNLRRGPSPRELLHASLAACTAIFIARNAAFASIPFESVEVTVGSAGGKIEKLATVTGDLSDEEFAACKFFADYCAIGETLKRGTELITDVEFSPSNNPSFAVGPLMEHLSRRPPPIISCDDNSCCVPNAI